jgi:hypothetical protein
MTRPGTTALAVTIGALAVNGCGSDDLSADEARYAQAYERFCVELNAAGGDVDAGFDVDGLTERQAYVKIRRKALRLSGESLRAIQTFRAQDTPASFGETFDREVRNVTGEAQRVFATMDRQMRDAKTLSDTIAPLERLGTQAAAIDQSRIAAPRRLYDAAPTCKKGLQEDAAAKQQP